MSFLNTITSTIKTAAPIAANIVLPGTGSIIDGLMDTVLKKNAGHSPASLMMLSDEKKAEIINSNPELLAALKSKAMILEADLAKAQVENMGQVAGTIQAELKHTGKTAGWRSFNGFMYPIAVLLCYVGIPVWNSYHPLSYCQVNVPEMLWLIWGGILGVAAVGKTKERTGNAQAPGILGTVLNKFTK